MRLKVPTPEIPKDNPYANDVIGRQDLGAYLTALVSQVTEGLVLSLHAPWGEGKTTFVRMWQADLARAGFPTIYFDAFAHDYLDDPFVGLAGELIDHLRLTETDRASLRKKASRAGAQLLTWGTKIAVRAATLGVVKVADIEVLEGIKDEISKDVSEVASAYIEQRLATYADDIKALDDFRAFLETAAGKTEKPLVFILDELDRCKPTYAIELLERIKHVFLVKGVVFVLVLNRQQMSESIRWMYGSDIDASTYLQKFIDIECALPKNLEQHQSDYEKYSRHLFRMHDFESWGEREQIVQAMTLFCRRFDLSLRAMQKAYAQLALFYSSCTQGQLRIPEVIALLCVLRIARRELYSRIVANAAKFADLEADEVLKQVLTESEWLAGAMRFFMLPDNELSGTLSEDEIRHFWRGLASYHVNRLRVLPYFCSRIEMFRLPGQ